MKTLPLRLIWGLLSNEDEHRRERDQGRITEYVDEIINLILATGMNGKDCNVEDFVSPLEEDQVNVIMMLRWITNARATLTLSLVIGRCYDAIREDIIALVQA